MYAKLIDNNFIIAPKKLNGENVIVYNPPAEMYASQGWLPVVFTEEPEAPSGYIYEPSWEQRNGKIVQIWMLIELLDDVDSDEALEILLGGAIE